MDFDKLHRKLSKTEMALFTGGCVGDVWRDRSEANPNNLIARLGQHRYNFIALRQNKASELMEAFATMASTTISL